MVATGCGRIGFDSFDSAVPDPCALGPFMPAYDLALNTTNDDLSPEISADGLTLYFASTRALGQPYDLWIASRAARAAPFDPPQPIGELNTAADETDPSISLDQLTLYFRSDRAGTADIYVSVRASPTNSFAPPMSVTGLDDAVAYDADPAISGDGLEIFFLSDRAGGVGAQDIWTATRNDVSASFGPPRNLVEVNSTAADRAPFLSPDGLSLYFSSSRSGSQSLDVYVATRIAPALPFAPPMRIGVIATTDIDDDPSVTADGRELFLSSDRPGGVGTNDVWSAKRDCL